MDKPEDKAIELEEEDVVEDSRKDCLNKVVLDSQSETARTTRLISLMPGGYAHNARTVHVCKIHFGDSWLWRGDKTTMNLAMHRLG